MDKNDLKPHWLRLIDFVKTLNNVKLTVDFEEGLPVRAKIKEIKQEEFDLTK